MKLEILHRLRNFTTPQMLEEQFKTFQSESVAITFPRELLEDVKQYIQNNYEMGKVKIDDMNEAIELDADPIINKLLQHFFYAEEVKQLYRVTVDVVVEAENEGDAEWKAKNELYGCDFEEVNIDSVYED